MVNKYLKVCSTSFINREITVSHYNKYRMAKTKLIIPMVDEESSVISHALLI